MRLDLAAGGHRLVARWGGLVAFDREPTNTRHRHDYFEVCFVLSGSGTYHHGGRDWPLAPGDVFLAEPGVVHEIASHATRDLRLAFLSFVLESFAPPPPDPVEGIGALLAEFAARRRLHVADRLDLRPLAARLVPAGAGPHAESARRESARALLLEGLAALTPGGEPAPVHPERDALDLIDALYGRPLSAAALAARLGVSERTLRRRFLAQVGHGPGEEIRRRHMVHAAHLLLQGLGVGEVAARTGFGDASFARAFRRVHGVPPKRFQMSYRPGSVLETTLEPPSNP